MGRSTSSAALASAPAGERGEAGDHELVAAVRRGDERAFETLYQRYQRRIHGYVVGMVKDHGRAEDVTQEVFVSALRRMRQTERPIAFKPWIYEIARNACIDAYRRSRRAEEVSFDADDGLMAADHRRLVNTGPTPDAALVAKQDLETLCGAFGGLSETHHEILVMRELEGLSYREIGERLGMSRPAVESTLFRARRRLSEEYDDLVSGARCRRIQGVMHDAGGRTIAARDARRLARHLAHCQSCRREAAACGLDPSVFVHRPVRRRVAAKVAAWLPFPAFARLRDGRDGSGAGAGAGWHAGVPGAAQLSGSPEQLAAAWGKLLTVAAVLLAGAGTHVGAGAFPDRGASVAAARPAAAPVVRAPAGTGGATVGRAEGLSVGRAAVNPVARRARASERTAPRGSGRSRRAVSRSRVVLPGLGGDRPVPVSPGSAAAAAPPARASTGSSGGAAATPDLARTSPRAVRRVVEDAKHAVDGAAQSATGLVHEAVGTAVGAVQNGTRTLDEAAGAAGAGAGAAGSGAVAGAVDAGRTAARTSAPAGAATTSALRGGAGARHASRAAAVSHAPSGTAAVTGG